VRYYNNISWAYGGTNYAHVNGQTVKQAPEAEEKMTPKIQFWHRPSLFQYYKHLSIKDNKIQLYPTMK